MMLIWSVAATVFLFLWYLLAMYWLRRQSQIRTWNFVVYYAVLPLLYAGVVIDVIYNIIPGSIIFLQLPRYGKRAGRKREITLSMRLHNIRTFGWGWRLMVADFICERILNPYDPKNHHC